MLDNESFFYELNKSLKIFSNDPYNNKKLAYDMQMSLLNKIILIEEKIRANELIIKENKKVTQNKLTRNNIRKELSTKSKILKDTNISYKEYMKKLRGIGDSIAFSYFSKYDLKLLCWKQSAGFISGKKGLEKELKIFKSYFDSGEFAILNDITNSLRFGDITISKNGKPDIIEVKTSNFIDKRVIKQQNDIKNKLNAIHNDYIENYQDANLTFMRVHSKEDEINYIEMLQNMIKESLSSGESFTEIEEGLIYMILNNITPQNEQEITGKLKDKFKHFKNPYPFCLNVLKSLNENYTPFPLIIKDSIALKKFYANRLMIIIMVDIDILKYKLNLLGYTLNTLADEELKIAFKLNNENVEIIMSMFHFYRLGRELLSLDWFVKSIDDVIKNIKSKY